MPDGSEFRNWDQTLEELYARAVQTVAADQKCSVSYIQRKLVVSYNRACLMIERMENERIVSAADVTGRRVVFIKPDTADTPGSDVETTGPSVEQVREATGPKPDPDAPQFEAVQDHQDNVAGDELRAFIERFERLEAEKKDIADGQKEVMAEAKGRGYDTRVIRKIIALRKRDASDIAEEEAVLEMYKAALGM